MAEAMRLLMAQVDDVSGEILGEFIRRVEALGARNVQIVASITKKGRPGHIVYVDVRPELESEVALLLGRELGTWGYRVLAAEHHHFEIERVAVTLTVCIADSQHKFPLRMKVTSHAGKRMRVKAEHDDLSSICSALREKACIIPVAALKAAVETAWSDEQVNSAQVLVRL